jgi:hypothetical protein
MAVPWQWKPKDAPSAGLLYEPGNWGDLIKLAWLLEVVNALGAPHADIETVSCVDPFAGAPDYPLTGGARQRLASLRSSPLAARLGPSVARGRWPSAATLLADMGVPASNLRVFDADPARRAALADAGRFTVMDLADGWDALAAQMPAGPGGLLVLDPYDFMSDWRQHLARLAAAARRAAVLAYVYNRAARGEAHAQEYRAFRNALEEHLAGAPRLLGRVAADAFLPRAHHEMLLLPGPALSAPAVLDALAERLTAVTCRLAAVIEQSGLVER